MPHPRWLTINGKCGSLLTDLSRLPAGVEFAHAARFLESTAKEYASFNVEYYNTRKLKDFPFCYGEWQNQSVIFLSMSRIVGAMPFSEAPYERKHYREAPENKRMDFWVLFRNNVFLIEYKHKVTFMKKRNMSQEPHPFYANDINSVISNWKELKSKVGTITERECKIQSQWDGKKRSLVKITFLVTPVCQYHKYVDKKEVSPKSKTESLELARKIKSYLKLDPDFMSIWLLPDNLQVDPPTSRNKEDWQSNHFVVFLAGLRSELSGVV